MLKRPYFIKRSSLSEKEKQIFQTPNEVTEQRLKLKDPPKISIFVTAYKSQDFIEECLDSIEEQTFFEDNDNFEVLVGVDGCEETLEKIQEISFKYRNLRVFMMDSNQGTYVTSNTLLYIADGEYILRFDSDDIMMPNLVNESVKQFLLGYDFLLFGYQNFGLKNDSGKFAHGILFSNTKKLKDEFGGYEDWRCAADTDLIKRIEKNNKINKINKILFKRRHHEESLVYNKKTGRSSSYRTEIIKLIYSKNTKDIFIEPIKNTYMEIYG